MKREFLRPVSVVLHANLASYYRDLMKKNTWEIVTVKSMQILNVRKLFLITTKLNWLMFVEKNKDFSQSQQLLWSLV